MVHFTRVKQPEEFLQSCYGVWKHKKVVGKIDIVKYLPYEEFHVAGNRSISLFPSSTTVN